MEMNDGSSSSSNGGGFWERSWNSASNTFRRGWDSTYDTCQNIYRSPYFYGSMQAIGGMTEICKGAEMTIATWGAAAPIGLPIMAHGVDHFNAGVQTILTGIPTETMTSQLFQQADMSPQTAHLVDNGISIFGSMGAATVISIAKANLVHFYRWQKLPKNILGRI